MAAVSRAESQRSLEDDIARVSAEFQVSGKGDAGGKSPMIEVHIMTIAGEEHTIEISRDDRGAGLAQRVEVAMRVVGRVELFFEGNPVAPGALSESGIKDGSVVDAVVVEARLPLSAVAVALADANPSLGGSAAHPDVIAHLMSKASVRPDGAVTSWRLNRLGIDTIPEELADLHVAPGCTINLNANKIATMCKLPWEKMRNLSAGLEHAGVVVNLEGNPVCSEISSTLKAYTKYNGWGDQWDHGNATYFYPSLKEHPDLDVPLPPETPQGLCTFILNLYQWCR